MRKVDQFIIGAGPAGLAVAGRFRKKNIPFEMYEQAPDLTSSWRGHYDRLCLHTVRMLSHLPHLPIPESYPLYVPRLDLVKYFESYADHFKIDPKFEKKIVRVIKKDNAWLIETEDGEQVLAKNVIVATGVNRVPNVPKWEGYQNYKGTIMHSRNYKNPDPFKGKRTLVIGMGNTGAEVALDLVEQGVETAISVRSAVNVVPRDLNGRPTQLTAKKLEKLPFKLGDWLGIQIRKFYYGDLSKYGLETSKLSPVEQLKKTGKTPVIDLGTIEKIKEGKIKVIGDVKSFHEDGVQLINGSKEAFGGIILATGYRAKLEEFIPGIQSFLDQYGVPKGPIGKGDFTNMYFVGFDNYKLGGLLGTIHTDSETVVEEISRV
ncbi:MAG: NAD(P)/FAD-dependent oxidoreductase [Bacteroidota bacterium]